MEEVKFKLRSFQVLVSGRILRGPILWENKWTVGQGGVNENGKEKNICI